MTLSEYINQLNLLIKTNPECINAIIIAYTKDIGAPYQEMHNLPTFGHYEDNKFYYVPPVNNKNAVCLN